MNPERGWYYHEGDPPNTVRLWDGQRWIGFPSEPPPGHNTVSRPTSAAATFKEPATPAPPMAVTPYALAATGAIGAMLFFALRLALQIQSELGLFPASRRDLPATSFAAAPLESSTARSFVIASVIGGLIFLGWLWRAHNSTGAARPRFAKPFIQGSFLGFWLFRAFYLMYRAIYYAYTVTYAVIEFLIGPTVRRMLTLIERSRAGAATAMLAFVWWVSWFGSTVLLLVLPWLIHRNTDFDRVSLQTLLKILLAALLAHIFALVCQLALVLILSLRLRR